MAADVATGKDLEVCLTQALDACACIQPAAGSPLIRRANDRDGRRSITMSNAPAAIMKADVARSLALAASLSAVLNSLLRPIRAAI